MGVVARATVVTRSRPTGLPFARLPGVFGFAPGRNAIAVFRNDLVNAVD